MQFLLAVSHSVGAHTEAFRQRDDDSSSSSSSSSEEDVKHEITKAPMIDNFKPELKLIQKLNYACHELFNS